MVEFGLRLPAEYLPRGGSKQPGQSLQWADEPEGLPDDGFATAEDALRRC